MIPFWYAVCLTFGPAAVGYVSLSVTAGLILGAIPLQLHLDNWASWVEVTDTWHAADLADLPHPRMSLMPVRQSPTDLPSRWDTAGLAAVALGSRARHACDVVAATPASYIGRHLTVLAAGEVAQEFRRIMATEFGSHRCDSCTVGRDGEPNHVSCVGCSCPCGTVEPLPEGVEGYAIAGRTR